MGPESAMCIAFPQKKSLRDHVTAHKLALLVLVREFCRVKRQAAAESLDPNFNMSTEDKLSWSHTNRNNRDFAIAALKLIQSPDMTLNQLLDYVKPILNPETYQLFVQKLREIYDEGLSAIMDYLPQLEGLLADPSMRTPVLHKSSFSGLFVRRMLLAVDKLTFSSMLNLNYRFRKYIDPVCAEKQESEDEEPASPETQIIASQRQAEYFLSQQMALMQINQKEALPPPQMQQKLRELLAGNPEIAEAHYLSFMNCLSVKEYCGAVDSLHQYFDRHLQAQDGSRSSSNADESLKCLRYASLNLAILHAKFKHKQEALSALQEAISLAQDNNDNVCLQNALIWLYRLTGHSSVEPLIQKSVNKLNELGLWHLSSLGIQALAHVKAGSGHNPVSLFEQLGQSDILNCQHSMTESIGTTYATKAALWTLYGFRRLTLLQSQLLLHLMAVDPLRSGGKYHINESTCLALRNIAWSFTSSGQYGPSAQLLNLAKELFPSYSSYCTLWTLCDLECNLEKALHSLDWQSAEKLISGISVLDRFLGQYQKSVLLLSQGHYKESLDLVNSLLFECKKDDEASFDAAFIAPANSKHFYVKLLLLKAQIYTEVNQPTLAIPILTEGLSLAEKYHMSYQKALLTLQVAEIQCKIGMPSQAERLLHQTFIIIMSHGGLYEKGRLHLILANCMSSKMTPSGNHHAMTVIGLIKKALEFFEAVQSKMGSRNALYALAMAYNSLGMREERNRVARSFRELDQQINT